MTRKDLQVVVAVGGGDNVNVEFGDVSNTTRNHSHNRSPQNHNPKELHISTSHHHQQPRLWVIHRRERMSRYIISRIKPSVNLLNSSTSLPSFSRIRLQSIGIRHASGHGPVYTPPTGYLFNEKVSSHHLLNKSNSILAST